MRKLIQLMLLAVFLSACKKKNIEVKVITPAPDRIIDKPELVKK